MTMLMRITTCSNITGCLCAAFLLLMLFFLAVPAVAADMASDEFLTGYTELLTLPKQRGSGVSPASSL